TRSKRDWSSDVCSSDLRGRVAVVDGTYAVFDQIWTAPDFRRQGLGSLTMRYLSSLALEHDVETGLLIAGLEGQALYTYLGWTARSEERRVGQELRTQLS